VRFTSIVIFLLPFIVSIVITMLVSAPGLVCILSYFVILGMVVGVFILADFILLYWRSKSKTSGSAVNAPPNLRIAVLVTAFNEDSSLVLDTSLSAKLAVGKQGDVYVLDDSTDEATRKQIDTFREYGFKVIRREIRRGYKAGAVNEWLKAYGSRYDLMAIFDADQRPMPFLFNKATPYFADEKVAFVQVPQYYSEITSGVSLGAFFQQLPFLRLVMRGRNKANSAFSLGSGTIYRVKALREIGGLDDSTITEDISTSIDLHSRGWRSVYIDKPLVWYGLPPKSIAGYLVQQGRWSLGGFQLLAKMIGSKLSPAQFFDYFNGWLYWFNVGPITFFEVFAPVIFLVFGVYFFVWNPLVYLTFYLPFFLSSIGFYFFTIKDQSYGVRGFVYHHTVQLLAFFSVNSSFAGWLMRKKRPFAVTPKGNNNKPPRGVIAAYTAIVCILSFSIGKGIVDALAMDPSLWVAYAINIFWAGYFAAFFCFGLYLIFRSKPYSDTLKFDIKPHYLIGRGKVEALSFLYESIDLEEKIAQVYSLLAEKLSAQDAAILKQCSADSAVHAKILRRILSWLDIKKINHRKQTINTEYLLAIEKFSSKISGGLDQNDTVQLLHLLLDTEKYFNEEVYIRILSSIFQETLVKASGRSEEIQRMLERIKSDEEKHTVMLRSLRDNTLKQTAE